MARYSLAINAYWFPDEAPPRTMATNALTGEGASTVEFSVS